VDEFTGLTPPDGRAQNRAGMRDRTLVALSLAVIAAIAPGCAGPRAKSKKPYVVVTFDTEDTISPEAEHIDDIPKWLAETMTEEGVTGTFFVIGEKARSLETRGRRDVIAAMAKHDIGSHTNFGSIHPTVTEELEKTGWDDGVRLMLEQESAGIRELERIFGIPVTTLARHGGSYGPQLVAALGRLGAGYQGSPTSLPGHDVVWFCNALNFSAQYSGFDDSYYRDDLFEPVFDKLKAELPERVRRSEVLALFGGHPTKIRAEEFWDLNFYNGRNTPPDEWRTPRLRPQETMVTAQKNFRRMMRWLKSREDIEITNYRVLMDVYSRQKETVTREELRDMANRVLREKTLSPTADFSPAEAFAGLAGAIAGSRKNGRLPPSLTTVHPLGPMEMPPAQPGEGQVTLEGAFALAQQAIDHIGRTGALPSYLEIGGARIGAGSLFALFSAVYLDLEAGRTRPAYDVPAFESYPTTHEGKIVAEVEGYKTWPVHRPDLDMSRIVEFTKLQLWTLKPARRR
jgi:peptidoglycan/xylan/chitin deacetylase (PgdA/CDA1 family)